MSCPCRPMPAMPVFTPDDIMEGRLPTGDVVLFDDDHYYMGGVLAELLARKGAKVTLVTPARLRLGLDAQHAGAGRDPSPAGGAGGRDRRSTAASPRIAADRRRNRLHLYRCAGHARLRCRGAGRLAPGRPGLYDDLVAREATWADAGIKSVKLIGDAAAPARSPGRPSPATAMPANWMSPISATPCPSAARSRRWGRGWGEAAVAEAADASALVLAAQGGQRELWLFLSL